MRQNKAKRSTRSRGAGIQFVPEIFESRRLLSAGSLVTSFGGTGIVDVPGKNGLSVNAVAAAVQTDGELVEVGSTSDHRVAVVRFNTNGTLDTTFGTGGESLFHFSSHFDSGTCIAIQPDGKIVVGGVEDDGDPNPLDPPPNRTGAQVAVARLNSNGTIDTSFGDSGGVFTINLTSYLINEAAEATHVLVAPGGYIYVTGTIATGSTLSNIGVKGYDFLALRLLPDGKLDHTYEPPQGVNQIDLGGNGNSYDGPINIDDFALSSTLDLTGTAKTNPNYGKLIIVGYNNGNNRVNQIGVVRLTTIGRVDSSFNGGNPLITHFRSQYADSYGNDVAIASNDDIIIAGEVWSGIPGTFTDFGIMALKSNGSLDTGFGSGGTTETAFPGKNSAPRALTIGQTGDIIVAGQAGGTFAAAAYLPTGKLDTSFGSNGLLTSGEPAATDIVSAAGGTLFTVSSQNSNTEELYDIVPTIQIGTLNPNAYEQGPTGTAFLVTDSFRASYPITVYLSISGTATPPSLAAYRFNAVDYTVSGMTIPFTIGGRPFVIIPANSTFASVSFTPIDDTRVEGDETAIFSIAANASYNISSTLPSTTITIHDNDGPATKAFNASADAYVRDGTYATTNFGTANQLVVKDGGTGNNRQSFITFNLSSLTSVNSVTLQLYGQLNGASTTAVADQVFATSTTWTETGITYNTKPAAIGSSLGTISVIDTTLDLFTLDVTQYVKAQFAAGHKVVSFVIKSAVSSNPYVSFNSRENTDGPQLIVS